MLDPSLKAQLISIFAELTNDYILDITIDLQHESREELLELLHDVADCSGKISCQETEGEGLRVMLLKNNKETGIVFRAVPNGHEFTTLLLAILNSDGKGKNIPDEAICGRVMALKGNIKITSYISLTCTNCPDVVQALNIMATLNENIIHEIVDGAIYQEEVDKLKIQAVPTVFADGQLLSMGKADFGELLSKLEKQYGSHAENREKSIKHYDVVVVGSGPAGASAAIYSARKGLKVAVLAERVGGQVKETVDIENLISVPKITGNELANNLKQHIGEYAIDLMEHRKVEQVEKSGNEWVISVAREERFITPALIIATGAYWRKLNVIGETEYIGKGVAFCPHCDGPFYKGKEIAVIGGGNSGIEAAIDLAGICAKVTVFEFLDELKADRVLQEKVKTLPNVELCLSSQTTEIIGNGERVTGIKIKDRKTELERIITLDGIFIQIGLTANSTPFKDIVKTNAIGEIEIDSHNRTSVAGIYAAGDVTTVPYKQIIIAMGEGAKAALAAFEDNMRSHG